ncbi:hypothetical protein scyTo_0009544, partial [Scyliorhinus torazame]|nr:hypothetical protein [Scyliorhinus torazame]
DAGRCFVQRCCCGFTLPDHAAHTPNCVDDDDIQFEDFDHGGPMGVTEDLKEGAESPFSNSHASF